MKLPSYRTAALTVAGVSVAMTLVGVASQRHSGTVARLNAETAKSVAAQQEMDNQVQARLAGQEATIADLQADKNAACNAFRTAAVKLGRNAPALPIECQ